MQPANYQILLVDDEESMREFLSIMLHREGYRVDAVGDGAQAVERLKVQGYDLVISDIKMPRLNGFELLAHIRERFPETVVLMITAFSTTEEAVEAMKQGAYDYITKPFKNEEIRLVIKNALERRTLRQENLQLKKELDRRYSFGSLIGKSKKMQEVYDLIEKVAASRANVLVAGESGTGKELVAKAIHYNSERKEKPFIAVNCGAIPENLLESELFGHEKGSFTGAVQQKAGLFEVANGGTLFLDEIGELPPPMQVKLLRVLQEREFRRVGGTKNIQVDVRLVAAPTKTWRKKSDAEPFARTSSTGLTSSVSYCPPYGSGGMISRFLSSTSSVTSPAGRGWTLRKAPCAACSITTGRATSVNWKTLSNAASCSASQVRLRSLGCRRSFMPAARHSRGSWRKSPTRDSTSMPTLVVSKRISCSRLWRRPAASARGRPNCWGSLAPFVIG
jgi:DNA-binding response OmpR family regulator